MAETKRTLLERLDVNVKALLSLFPTRLRLRFGLPETRITLPQGTSTMAQTLVDNERVSVLLEADDAVGNPTAFNFPTPPTWASSDESIVTVSANADGSNASVVTTGKLGSAQVTVTGINVAGVSITGIGEVNVVPGDATTFKLNFGTPEKK
jgi:hypothetical protein